MHEEHYIKKFRKGQEYNLKILLRVAELSYSLRRVF